MFSGSPMRIAVQRKNITSRLSQPSLGCLSGCPSRTVAKSQRRRTFSSSAQKETKESIKQSEHVTNQSFIQRFLGPKIMPERGSFLWYREMVLLCTVFAITGTSTMVLVRPAMSNVLSMKGSLKDGPWSYRICSIVIMTPLYACMLVLVGTTFGRHAYFRHFAVKMFSRFGIPPELMDASFHQTAKNFRKW